MYLWLPILFRYLATTQMEPVDARKAFPCFDEPDMKAKFKVTIVRKPEMISLSNMRIERSQQRCVMDYSSPCISSFSQFHILWNHYYTSLKKWRVGTYSLVSVYWMFHLHYHDLFYFRPWGLVTDIYFCFPAAL